MRRKGKSTQNQPIRSVEGTQRKGQLSQLWGWLSIWARGQSQAGAVPSWETGLIPGEPTGEVGESLWCTWGMISDTDREGPGPAHFATDSHSPRGCCPKPAGDGRNCPQSSNLPWPFAFLPVFGPPFWHFLFLKPISDLIFFLLVLIKEIADKGLYGCSCRGSERGNSCINKGNVAWKSHTDLQKRSPRCEVPFSVVVPFR